MLIKNLKRDDDSIKSHRALAADALLADVRSELATVEDSAIND
jgi:hypothetical protein